MASSSSSYYPPLVTAVSSASEGLVAVAHPQQDVPGLSSSASAPTTTSSWRVGLYNVKGGGGGYLQTTLTANANDKQRSISGRIQRLLFLGGEAATSNAVSPFSSHYLAAVSSQCVGVWDLRRGVVSHTIVPAKKSSATPSSHHKIVDAQVAAAASATSHHHGSRHPTNASRTSSEELDAVNARSLYLLVQHGTDAAAGGGDDNDDDDVDLGDEHSTKSVIWQYDGSQLVRKIKTKDGNSGRLLVTPGAQFLYVSSRRKVRVHSGQTGKVVTKLSFSSPVVAMAIAAPSSSQGGQHAAYVLLESGAIHLAHPNSDSDGSSKTTPVAMISTSHLPTALSLSSWPLLESCPASNGDSLGEGLLVGGRSLILLSGDAKREPVASSPKLLLDLATVDSGVVRCAVGAVASNKDREATGLLVAVLYKGGSIQVQRRDPRGADGTFVSDNAFAWRNDEAGDSAADRSGKRSKATRDAPAVLGPAQAGGTALRVNEPGIAVSKATKSAMGDGDGESESESDVDVDGDDDDDGEDSSPPRKRSRSEEQPNDETIASRLAQLRAQLIADEEEEARQDAVALSGGAMSATAAGGEVVTFQPKKATTESLSQLLKQALQDDALLEMCLAVSNPSIIRESVADLPSSDVSALVAAVTSRVAFRPARAEALCLWLTVLLRTRKASLEVLQPLQNLINDRIELLPALLKLEGRLSLLNP